MLPAYMMEQYDSAHIAIVDGLANNTTYLNRYNGFMAALEGKDNYEILVHDYCNVDRTTAQTMTENYITGFDNLDTVSASATTSPSAPLTLWPPPTSRTPSPCCPSTACRSALTPSRTAP